MGFPTFQIFLVHIRYVFLGYACFFCALASNAQTSEVIVSVNWPNYSAENKLEVFQGNTLLASFCDTANCFTSIFDDTNYSASLNLGCLPDGDGYSLTLYDFGDDGWDGDGADNPNVSVFSAGVFILSNCGIHADQDGITVEFSVSGGGAACAPTNNFSGKVYVDLDEDQMLSGLDTALNSVVVELFEDIDSSGTVTAGDILEGKDTTDANGDFDFDLNLNYGGVTSTVLYTPQDDSKDGNSTSNKHPLGKNEVIGVRFREITIPADATVTNAFLYFTPDESSNKTGSVQIYGEDEFFPADYTPLDDVSARAKTMTTVDWTFSNWTEDEEVQSSDITNIINELISNHGPYSNGFMNFILVSDGDDEIDVKSFERNGDEHQSPRLVIYYDLPDSYEYIAIVDTASLPVNGGLSTDNIETAIFTTDAQNDLNNNFGFAYTPLCTKPFIGADLAICSGDTITIIAYSDETNQTDSISGDWTIRPQSPSTTNVTSVLNDSVIQVTFYAEGLGPFVDTIYFETVGGCSDTALLVVNTKPTFIVKDTSICAGSTLDLTTLVMNYASILSPEWHIGTVDGALENTPTAIVPSSQTDYFLIGINVHGCKDTASIQVNLTSNPNPSLTSDTICQNTMMTLDAGSYANYSWSSGEMTQTITKGAGTYTLTVTDINGCTASTTATISESVFTALTATACQDNGTPSNGSDDYFTVSVLAEHILSGSGKFLVVYNGTTLNPGGTNYGSPVLVGTGGELAANGVNTYTLIIQDFDDSGCTITKSVGPVSECTGCPPPICFPVELLRE